MPTPTRRTLPHQRPHSTLHHAMPVVTPPLCPSRRALSAVGRRTSSLPSHSTQRYRCRIWPSCRTLLAAGRRTSLPHGHGRFWSIHQRRSSSLWLHFPTTMLKPLAMATVAPARSPLRLVRPLLPTKGAQR
jgi:hypothetical protein